MRCFVALWPDDAARERLAAVGREQQRRFPHARAMRAENLHLTLAFIGELDAARAARVAAALDALPVAPFAWTLDAVGAFERARVLWAAGPDCAPLAALALRVRQLLDELCVPYDRKPFVAHVTLLRDLARGAPPRRSPHRWYGTRIAPNCCGRCNAKKGCATSASFRRTPTAPTLARIKPWPIGR
jgi:2'-5' RNA ligase